MIMLNIYQIYIHIYFTILKNLNCEEKCEEILKNVNKVFLNYNIKNYDFSETTATNPIKETKSDHCAINLYQPIHH